MINNPTNKNLPWRPCVGIMVLNQQGKVWVGHRIPRPGRGNKGDARAWQMPQGGIDTNEAPLSAAIRELYEETGIASTTLLAEAPGWISYDLPDELVGIALKGKFRGQRQRWFAFRFDGEEHEIRVNPPPGGEKAEFDQWKWVDMQDLPDLVVEFKRRLYLQVIEALKPLLK